MKYERFVLRSSEGEALRSDLRYVADGKQKPVLLFLHGFKGFKDWGPFPAMLEHFARAGFVAIAFNFSHNGIGEDLLNFTELERFEHNTFSRELAEVGDVLREIESLERLPIDISEIDPVRLGLIGHSRGGGMAILAGRWHRQVRAIAAISAVSTFERYTPRQKERWRERGYFEVMNMRTKQTMRLGLELLEDLERHADKLNILHAAAQLPSMQKPLCVITGTEDLVAPVREARAIAEAARGPYTELVEIPQAGHTFGASHPYEGSTPALDSTIASCEAFFQRYLIEQPLSYLG